MTSITIRNVDETVKRQIKMIAASNGRSMEAEVREILKDAVSRKPQTRNIGQTIHQRFKKHGGVELVLPRRGSTRKLLDFK
jgi:antitoxin FitA